MIQADIIFLGGGPGGYTGALHAARSGLRTVLVEADQIGGTCLNVGCIPSKAWLATASVARTLKASRRFGFSVESEFVYERARKRVEQVVQGLRKGLGDNLLPEAGVEILQGYGMLTPEGVDIVGLNGQEQSVVSETIVLATGSEEWLPPGFALHPPRVITSREALFLHELPERVLIVGAGAIGCEFASFWTDIGVNVTLVEMAERILPAAPQLASDALRRGLAKRKVKIYASATALVEEVTALSVRCRIRTAEGDIDWSGDSVLLSVGRKPRTERIGLESRGIVTDDRGRVVVDPVTRETSTKGVYACGDITEGPMLAHKAIAEAVCIVDHILGRHPQPLDWRRVPMCVYSEPEIAWIGTDNGQSATVPVAASGRARAEADIDGLFALSTTTEQQVVGMLAVGAHATESILVGSLAMAAEEGLALWRKVIAAHPTRSELIADAVAIAAGGYGHNI